VNKHTDTIKQASKGSIFISQSSHQDCWIFFKERMKAMPRTKDKLDVKHQRRQHCFGESCCHHLFLEETIQEEETINAAVLYITATPSSWCGMQQGDKDSKKGEDANKRSVGWWYEYEKKTLWALQSCSVVFISTISLWIVPLSLVVVCWVVSIFSPDDATFALLNDVSHVSVVVGFANHDDYESSTISSLPGNEQTTTTTAMATLGADAITTAITNPPPFFLATLTTLTGAYAIGSFGSWLEQQIIFVDPVDKPTIGLSAPKLQDLPGSTHISFARTFKISS
jgi:hypothetical protein